MQALAGSFSPPGLTAKPPFSKGGFENDFLAFTVERGLIAVSGLILFALVAIGRAIYLLMMHSRHPDQIGLNVVIFSAIIAAIMLVSLTHQIFHAREMWLVFALQEAMVFKITEAT